MQTEGMDPIVVRDWVIRQHMAAIEALTQDLPRRVRVAWRRSETQRLARAYGVSMTRIEQISERPYRPRARAPNKLPNSARRR